MKRILKDEIILNDAGKTVKVLSNPSFKVIGLGLKESQSLEKHMTSTKAVLIVQFGKVEFLMNGEKSLLEAGSFFEIPENIEHEVHAVSDSYLYIIK